ncbi:MAG: class IV adenylate cyclase [Tepidisphaeraceae bacterium]|jgi:predicted adenylyl cyclase CyaB
MGKWSRPVLGPVFEMPIEIEAKMKVPQLRPLRQKLGAGGGKRVGSVLEINQFFDTRDAKLRKADSGLRIRIVRDQSGKRTCILTFKGPMRPGRLKQRDETQFAVDNPKAARRLLENLGYQPTLSFEKRRESWTFRKCKVELDKLPHLGTFVEIEGPSASQVMAARQALGLADLPLIRTSYIAMLAQYVKQHRIRSRHIRL